MGFVLAGTSAPINDYDQAWKALEKNDRKTANLYLAKAMKNPATTTDAFLTYIFMQDFEGKADKVTDFIPKVYDKVSDPNPYVYAMWFNDAALGNYGKKTQQQQLQLLERILNDPKINGSLKASARYFKGSHYQASMDFAGAHKEWDQIGAVEPKWQLVGPFDNLSGSGFNKDFGPLQHPEPDSKFTAATNASISWFVPQNISNDGWVFPQPHFRHTNSVLYAQTFVNSPNDQKLLLTAGCYGAIKIWVNDKLIIQEPTELQTELDYFKKFVQLKKGYNRLLVQLSFNEANYPNFIVRFTDNNYNPVSGLNYSTQLQSYQKETGADGENVRHFAEVYFENKIKQQPSNLVNYILLCKTYLRNKKTIEARNVLAEALKISPNNSLVREELLACYQKDNNRTLLMQEVERLKNTDANCMLVQQLNIQQSLDEEKYDEAAKKVDAYESSFGADEYSATKRINILGNQNKMEDLLKLIRESYAKYPTNTAMVRLMFKVKNDIDKDPQAALKVYEEYLKSNYNDQIMQDLAAKYNEQGSPDKALATLETIRDAFSYDPDLHTDVARQFYQQQKYKEAVDNSRTALKIGPYVSAYWENLGLELKELQQDEEAIDCFKKAVYYDANKYTAREHIRELQKKPSLWKLFPETDVYELAKKATKTYDNDYYYLLNEKFTILYPEGASEEYNTIAIKILNKKGIDTWKESTISYNSNSQSLSIEKAEVIKKNGAKSPAEQNNNSVVFTNLEEGDVVLFKYKLQSYSTGRLAKEYWSDFLFKSFVPMEQSRFCFLVANNIKFDYKTLNFSLTPQVKNLEDYKMYTWETQRSDVYKSEPIMPNLSDVGEMLYISTVKTWDDIATWYSDISSQKPGDVYELNHLFDELFPNGTSKLNEEQRARTIYEYIVKNIRYSSVSFRQGAFVPQKTSITINTKLGDCKDLSSLFVALARKAGLDANLILVSTRDNGLYSMVFPSVEFNHCIAQIKLNGEKFFIELTDNDLPFKSLPDNLLGAAYLFIPNSDAKISGSKLDYIVAPNRTQSRITRKISVTVDGNNIVLNVDAKKTGALTSSLRSSYASLTNEKQKEEFEKSISNDYKNPVKLNSIVFTGLDKPEDSVTYKYQYTVQNEVVEVGSMHMIKIPFIDVIASMSSFSADDRKFPLEYWQYENTDDYNATVEITAPNNNQFTEIPANESFSFKGNTYNIQYIQSGKDKLKIIRTAHLQKDDVKAEDYKALKDFLNKIVKAESKYIVFKEI
jgi:tetratricopeptide (TPR) repeat protein